MRAILSKWLLYCSTGAQPVILYEKRKPFMSFKWTNRKLWVVATLVFSIGAGAHFAAAQTATPANRTPQATAAKPWAPSVHEQALLRQYLKGRWL